VQRWVAYPQDSMPLASASLDATVRLWNLRLLQEVAILRRHHGTIIGAAFSADDNLLVSGSYDGTVQLWRAAPLSEMLASPGRGGG
jgi:COMPASS component SWD3